MFPPPRDQQGVGVVGGGGNRGLGHRNGHLSVVSGQLSKTLRPRTFLTSDNDGRTTDNSPHVRPEPVARTTETAAGGDGGAETRRLRRRRARTRAVPLRAQAKLADVRRVRA